MLNKTIEQQSYYYVNKEIVIIKQENLLNLAIVRFVDSYKEFVVDINFIETKPTKEKFISVKEMVR